MTSGTVYHKLTLTRDLKEASNSLLAKFRKYKRERGLFSGNSRVSQELVLRCGDRRHCEVGSPFVAPRLGQADLAPPVRLLPE